MAPASSNATSHSGSLAGTGSLLELSPFGNDLSMSTFASASGSTSQQSTPIPAGGAAAAGSGGRNSPFTSSGGFRLGTAGTFAAANPARDHGHLPPWSPGNVPTVSLAAADGAAAIDYHPNNSYQGHARVPPLPALRRGSHLRDTTEHDEPLSESEHDPATGAVPGAGGAEWIGKVQDVRDVDFTREAGLGHEWGLHDRMHDEPSMGVSGSQQQSRDSRYRVISFPPSGARAEAEAAAAGSSSGPFSPLSLSPDMEYMYLLPRRGAAEDCSAALTRLDKIRKANDAKRILRVKSLIKHRLKKKNGHAEKDSDSASELIDFGKAYEGVKLKIAALPGVNILGQGAAKAASTTPGAAASPLPSRSGTPVCKNAHAVNGSTIGTAKAEERENGSSVHRHDRKRHDRKATSRGAGMPPKRSGTDSTVIAPISASSATAAASVAQPILPTAVTATASAAMPFAAPSSSSPHHAFEPFLNALLPPARRGSAAAVSATRPLQMTQLRAEFKSRSSESDTSSSEEEKGRTAANRWAVRSGDSAGSASEDEISSEVDVKQISLQHGRGSTKRKQKRRLPQLLGDHSYRRGEALGDTESEADEAMTMAASADEAAMAAGELSRPSSSVGHGHLRTSSVGLHVSRGLHYATAQSRNRRAMERYSPAPCKLLNGSAALDNASYEEIGNIVLRSNTRSPAPSKAPGLMFTQGHPVATATPGSSNSSRTDLNAIGSVMQGAGSGIVRGQSPSMFSEGGLELERQQTNASSRYENFLQRWNTNNTLTSQTSIGRSSTLRNVLRNPARFLSRGKKRDTDAASVVSTPQAEDHDKALDNLIGKALQQAPPEDLGEKMEYDILYENQRGLLFFGVPRFSSRVLFIGDPSPWTSGTTGRNVAYTVANAQLPDPSWEWVHSEWMIDMSGDTDEAGWQYSRDFGHKYYRALHMLPNIGFVKLKGKERALGHMERKAARAEKRKQKEETREDDGLEALKRTALARSAKWQGSSDPWMFVRRRRWIRLRRRKALLAKHHTKAITTPSAEEPTKSHALEAATPDDVKKTVRHPLENSELMESDTESDDLGMDSSTTSEDDEVFWAPAMGHGSGFLPRRRPGNVHDGDPNLFKESEYLRKRLRHAKEFTGTVRELKSLIPAIVDPKKAKSLRKGDLPAVQEEIDARNPFISWKLVKRRLADDDLAFAGASLRTRERRFQHKQTRKTASKGQALHPGLPESLTSGNPVQALEAAVEDGDDTVIVHERSVQPQALDETSWTRDALVEINFRRVVRVLKACKVDRQKVELWRLWLGADSYSHAVEEPLLEDLKILGLAGQTASSVNDKIFLDKRMRALRKWQAMQILPDPTDVWDVLERRLDQVMLLFEYQGSRATLVRLLLSQHAITHPGHVFCGRAGNLDVPSELLAMHQHGTPSELGIDRPHSIDAQPWREAALPRLQFWSDLYSCSGDIKDRADMTSTAQSYITNTLVRPKSTAPEPLLGHQGLASVSNSPSNEAEAVTRPFSAPPFQLRQHLHATSINSKQ
ncbi:hypothetical protein K437DRAFT_264405 [Tilletiaria anomala UBC 951]|uniref:Uncharacterized protein n=1 Tax=Tilletiaria anomala (strain ATCC 24038 / CBS 436.72 / UBC 951) TaxID=1037660 RepID=A0A066VMG0_TILAU|nr:uncharacterized protein K437DRAFT_264405 [Tilletiaria anomala UBC 951]KDN39939.1 hypothetical protein K437DRAFT_264405 [Tilletiaria anomala UBC 951]